MKPPLLSKIPMLLSFQNVWLVVPGEFQPTVNPQATANEW
jgi:hypothetical protein